MDVWDCIRTRRSIRKFKKKLVPWDLIVQIMQAGRHAPTAGNLQSFKFLVVKNEEKRKAISESCLQQYWMANAPIHIAMIGEPEKMERYYGTRGRRLYLIQSVAAAVQNMLLMAHNLGLGACWIGAFDEDNIRYLLNLPEQVEIHAIIPIGYPDEEPEMPPKFRLEHMWFVEKWWGRLEAPPRTHIGWWSVYNDRIVSEGKKALSQAGEKISSKLKETVKDIGAPKKVKGKGKKK